MSQVAKYIVIESFADLQDKSKPYTAGDGYPRPANKKISEKRIEELSTNKNTAGRPFIEKVSEERASNLYSSFFSVQEENNGEFKKKHD